ncbi:hypothetical protein AAFF_G00058570 [Aldrovandia affinis]|uniref:Uncharacterized protein n=1 Tax=Aldrovandia affinis TaxID=143900 RepID=A0AAD7S0D2_9TELE|nr:hypothetical protein AAFF_G00058570 [Aldrovandia affinis]
MSSAGFSQLDVLRVIVPEQLLRPIGRLRPASASAGGPPVVPPGTTAFSALPGVRGTARHDPTTSPTQKKRLDVTKPDRRLSNIAPPVNRPQQGRPLSSFMSAPLGGLIYGAHRMNVLKCRGRSECLHGEACVPSRDRRTNVQS